MPRDFLRIELSFPSVKMRSVQERFDLLGARHLRYLVILQLRVVSPFFAQCS